MSDLTIDNGDVELFSAAEPKKFSCQLNVMEKFLFYKRIEWLRKYLIVQLHVPKHIFNNYSEIHSSFLSENDFNIIVYFEKDMYY